MSLHKVCNIGTSGLSNLDKKIKTLIKTKKDIEKREKSFSSINPVTVNDLHNIDISDNLAELKAIQRERLLEDLTLILNDKIKELEKKEKAEAKKEEVLTELTNTLIEKIWQSQISNKLLEEEKKRSEKLNTELQQTVKKLEDSEKELKVERDWLADQVEKKSFEVLTTIDQLIKAQNKTK
jgi:DNA repair exonuclease SbcCD ATPase subunit